MFVNFSASARNPRRSSSCGAIHAARTFQPAIARVRIPADNEQNHQHAARQAYIGLGTALIAAADEQVDATPMEGFDPAKVDEILGLGARGLRSVVILPLGYRAAEGDWLVNLKKVRRPREQFVTEV